MKAIPLGCGADQMCPPSTPCDWSVPPPARRLDRLRSSKLPGLTQKKLQRSTAGNAERKGRTNTSRAALHSRKVGRAVQKPPTNCHPSSFIISNGIHLGGPTWLPRRRGTVEHSDPLSRTGPSMKFAAAVLWFSLALGEAAAQGEESGERVLK